MLFCCLWRNVETSCHKHFVVVSRHQQTLPLTTSGKCHNLLRSSGTVLITPSAALTARGEARYRLIIAIYAYPTCIQRPLGGSHKNIAMTFGTEKLEWCKMLKIRLLVLTEFTNVTDGRTDRRADTA